jgi:hypothetical protein
MGYFDNLKKKKKKKIREIFPRNTFLYGLKTGPPGNPFLYIRGKCARLVNKMRKTITSHISHYLSELGTRSFFRGSLSAPHSIFSPGSLTLMRSFFEFPYLLVAQTLIAQPVDR